MGHIISRFGVPMEIITDNGTNFVNKKVDAFLQSYKIKHHRSTPYRPQGNGGVEAANKTLIRIIEKMVVTYRDWHEKLPYALWAYRTSIRTPTGATPFALTYGMEAVLPIEVEVPSLRVLLESNIDEAEWQKTRYEQLALIEEKRMKALCHTQAYQQRMARFYNKKVKERVFRPGDVVMKQILPSHLHDSRGKFKPTWEGPFIVKEVFSGGALRLVNMEGAMLPQPINSDHVKIFTGLEPKDSPNGPGDQNAKAK